MLRGIGKFKGLHLLPKRLEYRCQLSTYWESVAIPPLQANPPLVAMASPYSAMSSREELRCHSMYILANTGVLEVSIIEDKAFFWNANLMKKSTC